MHIEKTEGIVLKALPYQEHKKILTVFTNEGVLSFIGSESILKKAFLSSLSIAEFSYYPHTSQLHVLKDVTLVQTHAIYRKSYRQLEAAHEMLRIVSLSQLPGKPAPLLYQLLKVYLTALIDIEEPKILSTSFLLKTLKHEGLLSTETNCTKCENPPRIFSEGDWFCHSCSKDHALAFTEEEWQVFYILTHTKELQLLKTLPCEEKNLQQIAGIFNKYLE